MSQPGGLRFAFYTAMHLSSPISDAILPVNDGLWLPTGITGRRRVANLETSSAMAQTQMKKRSTRLVQRAFQLTMLLRELGRSGRRAALAGSCFLLLPGLACSSLERATVASHGPSEDGAEPLRGLIIPPIGGETFEYCSKPLRLVLKVDSVSAPGTSLVAGTGEIRGDEGIGRHPGSHEVIYIRDGWGYAVFGSDSTQLGPGSVVYVPPSTPHRLISTGDAPMNYFWVIGPRSSGEGFRRAATTGCDGGPPLPAAPAQDPVDSAVAGAVVFPPESGERITYCPFPLTITFKVDAESVEGTLLVAARGALRRGFEVGNHSVDEVVLITHGNGLAFVGPDTVPVEPGSVVFTPRGARHGFINEGASTLEYFVVYGPFDSPRPRTGFRNLAASPGRWCTAEPLSATPEG